MNSKVVLIALALFSAQASAEWEWVGETHDGKFYIDIKTIRKQGIYTYVWAMSDYFKLQLTADGKKYQSTKSLRVYRCDDMQSGIKSLVLYSGKFGAGDIVMSDSRELFSVEFEDVVPDSVGDTIIQEVCEVTK